ncbi:thiamine biosynthesis protein ApbE [Saccharobesus litoralis]|uniref:FAD:protein FMN transferase n=1 Tax=Saccharobesus litoralis TaxID=2172099 RepID=A0A2S0VWW7_9ALTE|nr:FAD:protein FMN transferase [Saccharobesus litoralis]AWB68716.1 thiamine biosynthesis protein ApbE [Saccharobesus litoralis]
MHLFQFQFKAMGSPCSLHFYAANQSLAQTAARHAQQEVARLESKYSRYRSSSLLSNINLSAGKKAVAIDNETAALLAYAEQAYQISDGLFDITTGVLRNAWNFKSKTIPNDETILQWLDLVGWQDVEWQQSQIYLPKAGMEIDFGGIVKEYASDAVVALLKQHQIQFGLVDMGGDIHVVGPHPNGDAWLVGVQNPASNAKDNNPSPVANIPMTHGGLASSGDYQRYIELQGKKYSHVLNPRTGWPVSGLAAVSVWSEQCVMAGTLATITMLKEEAGVSWLQELAVPFVAVDLQGRINRAV